METIGASDFKARCLAILEQVRATGERVVMVKRGTPVAELGPVTSERGGYPQSELRGTARVLGDIVAPAVPEEDRERLSRRRPLDTQVLVWWLTDPSRLSGAQQEAVASAGRDSPLLVSDISLWEIAKLRSLGGFSSPSR